MDPRLPTSCRYQVAPLQARERVELTAVGAKQRPAHRLVGVEGAYSPWKAVTLT